MEASIIVAHLQSENTPEARFCLHHRSVWTDAGKAAWLADSTAAGRFLPVRDYQIGGAKCPEEA